MKYYKCIRGTNFSYQNHRRDFAPNQVIKLDETSESSLKNILDTHPNFQAHEVEDDLKTIVPRIDQLLRVPAPARMMSREDVINEIVTYGIRPDIYAMDQVLEQQLSTLRIMTKKNFVTVVDNNGKPVYVQNLKEFIENLKRTKKEGQRLDDAKNAEKKKKAEIKIVEDGKYETEKKKEKGVTTAAVEKDDDSKYDSLKPFNEFVDEQSTKQQELSTVDLKSAISNKSEIDAETVTEELKFDPAKITPEYFRYLIELDNTTVFAKEEYSDKDKQEMRAIDWRLIPQDTLLTMLLSKGVNLREMRDNLSDQAGFRKQATEKLKGLVHEEMKTRGDLPIIEINAMTKRIKEVEKSIPKNLVKSGIGTLKSRLTALKKYSPTTKVSLKGADIRSLRQRVNLTGQLVKHGLPVPETIEEMEDILRSKGITYK